MIDVKFSSENTFDQVKQLQLFYLCVFMCASNGFHYNNGLSVCNLNLSVHHIRWNVHEEFYFTLLFDVFNSFGEIVQSET